MAQGKYDDLSQLIIDNVGGKENIKSVAHCITRLRLKLKDTSKANTEVIEKAPGVIKVMDTNGQYQIVLGNKVEDVYDSFLKVSGLSGVGEVAVDDEGDDAEKKNVASVLIDLISGIFAPSLGMLCAAGIMKGILALVVFLIPAFATDGAYKMLYTVADGFFYFLPVILGYTAAKKFKMSEFTGMAIGIALVYPTMVALTGGDVLGSVNLGIAGTFSWYTTFLGIPVIMPASGYTSSVIPIVLMVFFASKVESWCKSWMPASLKMFFVPLLTCTIAVVAGYLVIGPVATLLTNLLQSLFVGIISIPYVGNALLGLIVGSFWMVLVIFGFHWSLVPLVIVNISTLGYDFILPCMLGHSFALGAVVFAMYLKNKDEDFRELALPAMISAFFFGVTEPAIYGVALPNKRAFVNACIASGISGLFLGLMHADVFMMGGLGVFNWLCFIDSSNVLGAGINYMIIAIIASLGAAVIGFALEIVSYKPEKKLA